MSSSLAGVLEDRRRPPVGVALERGTAATSEPMGLEDRIRRMLILIALYAIPAVVVMRPVNDNDVWMNLRAGQWIVAHGTVPVTDPFSSTGQGRPWVAYSWLFEVLILGLYERLGLAGIVLYRVVLSFAILTSLHRLVARREPRFVVATGLVGLAFFALVPLLNERTWLFTLLFSTLTLDAILDLARARAPGPSGCCPPCTRCGRTCTSSSSTGTSSSRWGAWRR